MWDGVWFWAGVGSATVSAIFYGVYKNKERTIKNLRVSFGQFYIKEISLKLKSRMDMH